MENLEGFPGRTCPGISYRRWILFPLIFKSSHASTTHQPLVSTQQGWELRRGGGRGNPSAGTARTDGPLSHRVWAWQAEPGAGDSVYGQSQARWSDAAPSRSSKTQGWRLQHGSKVQPEDSAKDRTEYKLQRMYEESFQETSYRQPKSVQEPRPEAGCRQVYPQQSLGKEQRAGPELQGGAGPEAEGVREGPTELVCAVKGW